MRSRGFISASWGDDMARKSVSIRPRVCIALIASLSIAAQAQDRTAPRYKTGKEIYERICQACHMSDAQGAVGAGAYPALANNPRLENSLYPVLAILRGLKSMPSFSDLDDEQIAAVVNYVRSNFGNKFPDAVDAQQVKSLRATAVPQRSGRAG